MLWKFSVTEHMQGDYPLCRSQRATRYSATHLTQIIL